MIKNKYQRKLINTRKENGLCTDCGKVLNNTGIQCLECRERINKGRKELKNWYRNAKICPICGQESLFGDEKSCPECRAKSYAYKMKIDKEHKNKIHREWSKRTHAEMIEKGICTRCRKRKADGGFKTCGICRDKKNRRTLEKNYGKLDRKDRVKMGICYFCNNPVEKGYKVCEYHHRKNIEYANLDKTKDARKKLLNQGILY